MDLSFATLTLSGYLLALGRVVGFVLVAPPFNTRAIPRQEPGGHGQHGALG